MIREESARVGRYLALWADWMRDEGVGLGYPEKSPLFACGGAVAADAMDHLCEAEDAKACLIIDAAVGSLPLLQQAAVHHVWLAAVWRARADLGDVYLGAVEMLERDFTRRGLP